jgi:hypothetical protein
MKYVEECAVLSTWEYSPLKRLGHEMYLTWLAVLQFQKNTKFLYYNGTLETKSALRTLLLCVRVVCHISLFLTGKCNRPLIPIGFKSVGIGPVTNPTLFGIIKTPAASHSTYIIK